MHGELFDKTVVMWVYEEIIDGKKLSEVINKVCHKFSAVRVYEISGESRTFKYSIQEAM